MAKLQKQVTFYVDDNMKSVDRFYDALIPIRDMLSPTGMASGGELKWVVGELRAKVPKKWHFIYRDVPPGWPSIQCPCWGLKDAKLRFAKFLRVNRNIDLRESKEILDALTTDEGVELTEEEVEWLIDELGAVIAVV